MNFSMSIDEVGAVEGWLSEAEDSEDGMSSLMDWCVSPRARGIGEA
jgi:hypothetical protein